jgi:hypothetical protein
MNESPPSPEQRPAVGPDRHDGRPGSPGSPGPGSSAYRASAEHAPLSGLDEFLIHNSPYPVRVMWTPDAQAYERVWFTCQDKVGQLLVVIGLAFYPNLGTAEAFAILNVRGRHTTVRAHQRLRTDRLEMRLGPFSFDVVEPFRMWRLRLDPTGGAAGGAGDVAFDITWLDTKRPVFRQLGAGVIVGARALSPVAGYDGFGRQEGWVAVDGERFQLATTTHLGTRDHHWGIRDGVGGPALYRGMQHPHSGEWVEFEDFGIWGDHVLYNIGDARRRSATLAGRTHRMRFEPETNLLESGEVDLVFADGSVKTMSFERLGHQIAFLRCAMYGGPNGGTPDGDIWHGMTVAEGDDVVVHQETFDVNDPAVRMRLAGLDQHHCRITCDGEVTYGIVEPYDTLCYDVSKAGVMGFSLLDAPR